MYQWFHSKDGLFCLTDRQFQLTFLCCVFKTYYHNVYQGQNGHLSVQQSHYSSQFHPGGINSTGSFTAWPCTSKYSHTYSIGMCSNIAIVQWSQSGGGLPMLLWHVHCRLFQQSRSLSQQTLVGSSLSLLHSTCPRHLKTPIPVLLSSLSSHLEGTRPTPSLNLLMIW